MHLMSKCLKVTIILHTVYVLPTESVVHKILHFLGQFFSKHQCLMFSDT